MGWSGPGCQRHRAARTRVGHACGGGHRCRGGLKAHAPSFGQPGFATGSSGSSDAAAHACGPATAVALAIMRRGAASGTVRCRTRASPTIAKSSAIDQLNVAMDSIRFPTTIRQPRYAVRTRETTSGYQGNPDGRGNAHVCPDATGQVKSRSRCGDTRCAIHPVTRTGSRQRAHGGKPHRASHEPPSGRRTGPTEIEWNANGIGTTRTHSVTRVDGVGKREIQRAGNLPARRSGIWPRLRKPEGYSPIWPAMTARQAAGPNLAWGADAVGARCAVRAPSAPAAISPSRGDGDACGGGSHDRRDRRNRARTSCATCCRQAPRRHRRRPPHPAGRPCGRPSRCLPRYLRAAEGAADDRAGALATVRRHRATRAAADGATDHRRCHRAHRRPLRRLPSAPPSALFMSPAMAGCSRAGQAATTRAGAIFFHSRILPCSQSGY